MVTYIDQITCEFKGCEKTNVQCDVWYECKIKHWLCSDHQILQICPIDIIFSYSRRDCEGKLLGGTCSDQRSTGKWFNCKTDHFFCTTHQPSEPTQCPIHPQFSKRT